MKARNERLQCNWEKIEVTNDTELTFTLSESNVSDMEGTIELAKILMYDVDKIIVITLYRTDYMVYNYVLGYGWKATKFTK